MLDDFKNKYDKNSDGKIANDEDREFVIRNDYNGNHEVDEDEYYCSLYNSNILGNSGYVGCNCEAPYV